MLALREASAIGEERQNLSIGNSMHRRKSM